MHIKNKYLNSLTYTIMDTTIHKCIKINTCKNRHKRKKITLLTTTTVKLSITDKT